MKKPNRCIHFRPKDNLTAMPCEPQCGACVFFSAKNCGRNAAEIYENTAKDITALLT